MKYYGRLNVLSPVMMGVAAMIGIESPAIALPDVDSASHNSYIAQVGVRSRVIPPTPLNITPRPGTHIPLPASNYHNRSYDRYHHHYRGHSHYGDFERHHYRHRRHSRKRGTVIIINPSRYNTPHTGSNYIRVIRH